MLQEIYKELIAIRKELQSINNALKPASTGYTTTAGDFMPPVGESYGTTQANYAKTVSVIKMGGF